jgi:hypothetical protein
LQAEGDENLTLVARGTGSAFVADFQAVTTELGGASGTSGLLAEASKLTAGQPSAAGHVAAAVTAYRTYLSQHVAVRKADDSGDFVAAVAAAIGPKGQYPAFVQLDTSLRQALDASQQVFVKDASDARTPLDSLRYGIPILALLAAGLSLAGAQQRINDYR